MAAAPARRTHARPPLTPRHSPLRGMPAHKRVGPAVGGRIRCDRASRLGLLAVLVGILALYVGPARSYFSTVHEAKVRSAAVQKLKRENRRLRARSAALVSPGTLQLEARKLGMVRPGERAYVIQGLPKGG